MLKLRAIAAFAALLISGSVSAEVVFDPDAGTGFVGKGDVQLAFGWNNTQLQTNARAVTFTYALKATYAVTCEWDTFTGSNNSTGNGNRKVIHHEVTDGLTVSSQAVFDATVRTNKHNAVTGFNLTGYSTVAPAGGAPTVGDTEFCNAHDMGPAENPNTNSHTGAVVTATALIEGSESAGLFANFGDRSVQISN